MNHFHKYSYFILCLMVLLFVRPVLADGQKQPVSDMRILIDVSGSMKQNDPNNLRSPALKLLVGLLPNKSRAGVWTFGQQVNMQVKLDEVNDAWKKYARNEAKNIHSHGLFTNIEDALTRATFDWKRPDPNYQRTLILLTDGVVDISKDPALNKKSRYRILSEILPKLNSANVTVHTIALSNNADHELLKILATRTNGWYSSVTSANELKKKFLHLFEKSTQSDTIPFKGNVFTVDKSVSEMTVLIFRTEGSKPTELLTPDGKLLVYDSKIENMQWHHETGYDMITIKRPVPGKWKAKADIDPDNRVLVVTNLKLKSNRFEHNFLKGDIIPIHAHLEEKTKIIREKGFLDLVKFNLQINGKDSTYKLSDNGEKPDAKPDDGIFSSIIETDELGESNEILVHVRSATFDRQTRRSFKVFSSPASISISKKEAGEDHPFTLNSFTLNIVLNPALFVKGSVSIHLDMPDGKTLVPTPSINQQWHLDIPVTYQGSNIKINLSGKRYNHSETYQYSESLMLPAIVQKPKQAVVSHASPEKKEPVMEQAVVKEATPVAKKTPVPKKEIVEKIAAPENTEETTDKKIESIEQDEPEEPKENWFTVFLFVLIGNVVIFSGVVYGYFYWKKKRDVELEKDNAVFEDEDKEDATEDKKETVTDKEAPEEAVAKDETTKDKENIGKNEEVLPEESKDETVLSEDDDILKQQIELEDDDLDDNEIVPDEEEDEPDPGKIETASDDKIATEEPGQPIETNEEKNTEEKSQVNESDNTDDNPDTDATVDNEPTKKDAGDETDSVSNDEAAIKKPDQTTESNNNNNPKKEPQVEEPDRSPDVSSTTESEPIKDESDEKKSLLDDLDIDIDLDAPEDESESAEEEEVATKEPDQATEADSKKNTEEESQVKEPTKPGEPNENPVDSSIKESKSGKPDENPGASSTKESETNESEENTDAETESAKDDSEETKHLPDDLDIDIGLDAPVDESKSAEEEEIAPEKEAKS